jgi:hypothetical protein
MTMNRRLSIEGNVTPMTGTNAGLFQRIQGFENDDLIIGISL